MKKKSSAPKHKKSSYPMLSHLGSQKTDYKETYSPEVLEAFPNQHQKKNDQWVSFICPEFTSLCPKTGQPDFAKIFINYIPDQSLVESKSLKLYLFSYRNHGDFHENCIQTICDDLHRLLKPRFIEVIGEFTPRGGIALFPYSSAAQKSHQNLLQARQVAYSPGQYTLKLGAPW